MRFTKERAVLKRSAGWRRSYGMWQSKTVLDAATLILVVIALLFAAYAATRVLLG